MSIYDRNRTKKDVDEYINGHISDTAYTYHNHDRKMPWKEWKERAKLTEHLNYGCDFKDGACRNHRWSDSYSVRNPKMCCCVGCASNFGYLASICKDDVETYKSLFNLKTGFWRVDKGCILPRELRSVTCVSYNCYNSDKPEYSRGLNKTIALLLGGKIDKNGNIKS